MSKPHKIRFKSLDKHKLAALQRIHFEDQFRARLAEEMGRLADKIKKEGERGKGP